MQDETFNGREAIIESLEGRHLRSSAAEDDGAFEALIPMCLVRLRP
jgi:hypothetical protein